MLSILIASGVATGLIYAIVALGIVVLAKASEGVNFAHGDFGTIGGFIAYTVVLKTSLGYPGAIIVAISTAAFFAVVFYSFSSRLFEPSRSAALLVSTIGLSFILKGICRVIWGGEGDFLSVPPITSIPNFVLVGDIAIPSQSAVTAIGATAILVAFVLLFRYSRLGLFMRAVADNHRAARLLGVNTNGVLLASFVCSVVIAALAGVLIAPSTLIYPDLGFPIFVKGFAAAILGGIFSLPGAIVGGIAIGVLENLAAGYVSTHAQEVSAFIAIFLVLLFMPNGLFPRATGRRI